MPTNRKRKAYQGSLLLNEQPLYTLPHLAKALGGSDEAMLIQQIHFYLELSRRSGDRRKYNDGRWWTYNSFEEWQSGFFIWLSVITLKRMVRKLVDIGVLLIGHFSEMPTDRRNWYSIDYEKLQEVILDAYAEENQTDTMDDTNSIPSPSYQTDTIHSINMIPSIVSERDDVNLTSLLNESTDESLNISDSCDAKDASQKSLSSLTEDGIDYKPEDSSLEEDSLDELVYSDIDEFGNELGGKGGKQEPKWKLPTKSVWCERAFHATKKRRFGSKDERSRWIAIEKAMMPLDALGRVKYPIGWVEYEINWVREQNRIFTVTTGKKYPKYSFSALLTCIENEEHKNTWVAMTLQKRGTIGYSGPQTDTNVDIYADLPPRITDESLEEDAIGDG